MFQDPSQSTMRPLLEWQPDPSDPSVALLPVHGRVNRVRVDTDIVQDLVARSSAICVRKGGQLYTTDRKTRRTTRLATIIMELVLQERPQRGVRLVPGNGDPFDMRSANIIVKKVVPPTKTRSKFPGVIRRKKVWIARAKIESAFYNIGEFESEREAGAAYRNYILSLFPNRTHPLWSELEEDPGQKKLDEYFVREVNTQPIEP